MFLDCLLNFLQLNADISLGGGGTAVPKEPLHQCYVKAVCILDFRCVPLAEAVGTDTLVPQIIANNVKLLLHCTLFFSKMPKNVDVRADNIRPYGGNAAFIRQTPICCFAESSGYALYYFRAESENNQLAAQCFGFLGLHRIIRQGSSERFCAVSADAIVWCCLRLLGKHILIFSSKQSSKTKKQEAHLNRFHGKDVLPCFIFAKVKV